MIEDIIKDPFNNINKLSIKELEEIIIKATNLYYNTDKPLVSDAIYDLMIEFLKKKNPTSDILKNIGAKVINSKNKIKLPYHLGSMDKIKPGTNKLSSWIKKFNSPYYLSDKLDGISGLLIIENKNSTKYKLYTRGTSIEGMDISNLTKYLKLPNINKVIRTNKIYGKKNILAIRGEIVISKKNFKNNIKNKKNIRNTVAGIVNSIMIDPLLSQYIDFIAYEIVDPFNNFSNMMEHLKLLNFSIVNYTIMNNITEDKLSKYLIKRRKEATYDIDGIIVTNNDIHIRNNLGNPKYAFAFKDIMEDQIKETVVKNIDWKISKDGKIVPTLVLKPIEIGGVMIQRVTAHNAKMVYNNNINIGTVILLIRSGDVIPYIKKIIKKSKTPLMPSIKWSWGDNKIDIYCCKENKDIILRNIQYFFKIINAKGMGPKVIEKLYNNGFNTIEKILSINKDNINIEGFKEKSINNMINNIKKALTNIPLSLLMSASNKFGAGMGVKRLESIIKKYPNIMETKDNIFDMIRNIYGFEEKTAKIFSDNINNFKKFYKIIKNKVKLKKISKKYNKLNGLKFVFSGFRDKNLEKKIINNGGNIITTISSNTDYLIVKDINGSSSKIIKAKDLGIKIITIDDVNNMI